MGKKAHATASCAKPVAFTSSNPTVAGFWKLLAGNWNAKGLDCTHATAHCTLPRMRIPRTGEPKPLP